MTDRLHWWSFNCNLGCSDQSMLIWDSHVFFQSWSPSTSSWWRCGSWSSPGPGQSSSSWGTSSPSSSTSQHTGKCFSWENFSQHLYQQLSLFESLSFRPPTKVDWKTSLPLNFLTVNFVSLSPCLLLPIKLKEGRSLIEISLKSDQSSSDAN